MFGLGEQVRSYLGGVGSIVGDDEGLCRAWELVDVDGPINAALCEDDEQVAWAKDLVDPRNGLSALCHRADRLCPTDLEDPVDAGNVCRDEHLRALDTVSGRHAQDDFGDTRDARWDSGHQDSTRVGTSASWGI